jgi:hypothetical protein
MGSPAPEVQYLYDWLRDEFRRHPEVMIRIRPAQEADGVSVRTPAREYFFETEWVREKRFDRVSGLASQILDLLER